MSLFGNYQILETIADNAAKSVYRCSDNGTDRTVILKVLKAELTGAETVMRFKQEYRLLQELSGKIDGVIRPVGLQEMGGYYIMVLEDIGGKSLKRILAEDKPDQRTLLRLAVQVIDILGAIHDRHVIHKDIKPSNIIWNREQNKVQIIDFDLAVKLSKEKHDFRNSGVFEGSLHYISPEQTGRMSRSIDYRSDYYSYGVMLYEMFTAMKPFDAGEILEQIYSIIAKEAVPPDKASAGQVSPALSAVIMKLMEKSPEDRYRSAFGIKADLKKCLAGSADFTVGAEDRLNIFRIPQKLYGREGEIKRLEDAFRRCARGTAETMFVTGEAGAGKTALVHELHRYISRDKGLFAEGKFDQYNRNIPYSAVIQAFRRLTAELLESPDTEFKAWIGRALVQALDGNGSLIAGLIPELTAFIGPQPDIGPLHPQEETNRFYMTFAQFLIGLTGGERPLVLFLDDLQWADYSSLQLIERLMQGNQLRRMLVVLSYRSHEIPAGHPLFAIKARLEKSGKAGEIQLDPLPPADAQQLIADTLYTHPEEVTELAHAIYKRTKGNSFYINELLKELHRGGYLYFNDIHGEWTWRLSQIAALPVNDNVVDFLMTKLILLPAEQRDILTVCAAIGNEFDYTMLLKLAGAPVDAVVHTIAAAVEEEFIRPADRRYSLLSGMLGDDEAAAPETEIRFAFSHDRIQQAFYQMLDEQKGKQLHLKIGRLMLERLGAEVAEDKLVDIAAHMNKALELIRDKQEMEEVITLNLRAARKAKAGFGYPAAYALLEAAMAHLPEHAWAEQPQQTAEIYRLYAECGYLTHHVKEADRACAVLAGQIRETLALAEIYEMQANYYMYLGMMQESIAAGRQGLAVLGLKIPGKVGMPAVLKELVQVKARLRGKSVEELFAAPDMSDPQTQMMMRLLVNFIPPAFISGETSLFGLVVLRQIKLTLSYGNAPESALAFIGYAMLLSGFGDIKGAFDYGRLGIRINDKFQNLQWKGAAYVLYTLFSHVWTEPWDTLQEWFTASMEASLKTGDLLYLAHSSFYVNLWNPTLDIPATLQESSRTIAMIEDTKYKESLATAKLARQYFLNLAGELADNGSFDGDGFSEEVYLRELTEAKYYSGIAIYYIYKMKLLFTYERSEEALVYIDQAYPIIGTLAGSAFMEEFALFTFLNLACCYPDMNPLAKGRARRRMRKEFGRVRKWAGHAPETFRQHEYLMRAEWARISGQDDKAGQYYDLAIEASERSGFVRYKALASELAARFYYHKNFKEFAAYLFRQSEYYYSVWGAKGKIAFIAGRYPELVSRISTKEFMHRRSISDYTESIDLDSILLASQAISKEIELNNLLEALMEIVIKNAGAQRGCILMTSKHGLLVEGEYNPEEGRINVAVRDFNRYDQLPESILKQVEERKESVIYNDAFSETPFVNDPYIVKHRPKSLVCMPLINQNKTIAIIYLENNLLTGVFTRERMRIINLLSREMVFSLENASLYSELERSEEKYRELVGNLQDGIFITQDAKCRYVNEALGQMLGYSPEEMLEQPFEAFLAPGEREKVRHYYMRRMRGKQVPVEYETRLLSKDGREIIVIHKPTLITYMNRPAIQGTVKDITERKRAEEELLRHKEHLEDLVRERTIELEFNNDELNKYIRLIEQISITDELTGLYNRRYFNKLFEEEVEKAAREQRTLTYLMLDIDYFKKYNDTYGHYEGDRVLQRVGAVLQRLADQADGYAFRLGGEEFGILIPGFTARQSREYAESIRRSVSELRIAHEMSPEHGIITVSIGVAAVQVNRISEEDIYKLGDDALYESKDRGRNCVTLIEK
ncbi:diguanylate cyclase [Paenibacillus tengchongensis]|uniref:diguanylate cyclase n=1 Tax=Paenibacillus tengchongensis TaxID=2608684 RepID=UPI00124BE144|nr:diguanylate cyclase [Paenibacillus tengchongensis]